MTLTPREYQIAECLSKGLRNKDIARTCMLTEGTVKTYCARLSHKLGVPGRFGIAMMFTQRRVRELEDELASYRAETVSAAGAD